MGVGVRESARRPAIRMSETGLGFLSPGSMKEPLIFESLILEFRWRNSERSMAPKQGGKRLLEKAIAEHLKTGPNNDSKN